MHTLAQRLHTRAVLYTAVGELGNWIRRSFPAFLSQIYKIDIDKFSLITKLKGSVVVTLNNPAIKNRHVRFTRLFFKPLSDQKCEGYRILFGLKSLNVKISSVIYKVFGFNILSRGLIIKKNHFNGFLSTISIIS